ncbi:MAG: TonB-dependent receptor, partial [Proteobacteria bacterium]|nr:TonB-dependent receptor [Pseudomonadota bacterium]
MRGLCLSVAVLVPVVAHAQSAEPAIVVTAPGGAIDADESEGVDAAAINAGTHADLTAALQRNVAGVTLGDAQGNPWQ